jgi:hypothetical protein
MTIVRNFGKHCLRFGKFAIGTFVVCCLAYGQAGATSVAIPPLEIIRKGGDVCFLAERTNGAVQWRVTATDVFITGPQGLSSQIHKKVAATLTSDPEDCLTYSSLFGSGIFNDLSIGLPYEVEISAHDVGANWTFRGYFCIELNAGGGFSIVRPDLLHFVSPPNR